MKILSDESEQDDDIHRRTPRRVRFGGEIVKMRTPDSDSSTTNEKETRPTKSAHNTRSLIPIPVTTKKKSHSEPNSPQKVKKPHLRSSAPDLRENVFGPKVIGGVSKIPKRKKSGVFKSTIKITIDTNEGKTKKSDKHLLNPATTTHQGIEILYNLTQSPQRNKETKERENEEKTNFDSFQVCDVNFGNERKERNASFVRVDNSDSETNSTSPTNPIDDIMKELQRQVSFRYVFRVLYIDIE